MSRGLFLLKEIHTQQESCQIRLWVSVSQGFKETKYIIIIIIVWVRAVEDVWLHAWALRRATHSDLIEGDSKINSLYGCVPRLAVSHQPEDCSDWSICVLFCAPQLHLTRSQSHTLCAHTTSRNFPSWDSWPWLMLPNVPLVPELPVLLTEIEEINTHCSAS